MDRVMAKIIDNGNEQIIEAGLEKWDETTLYLVLKDGSQKPVPKNDVLALQITNKVFYLDGQEVPPEEPEEIVEEKKPFTIAPMGSKQKKGDGQPSFKLQQCIDIVKANPNLARKTVIMAIMKKTGMSEAGASTYHQLAKKHLGL
jgi:hypothetical protein